MADQEMADLFDSEFTIEIKEKDMKSLLKSATPKKEEDDELSTEKKLKSNKLTLDEKLAIIKENVHRVLGKQKDNIVVIRDRDAFEDYITKAIESKAITVDTETNNSLDPTTCDIMGLCLYYPGGKQAYIPVNHVDNATGELLLHQLTETDINVQLQRVKDAKTLVIMHNGKFDYEVIKCTCGIELPPDWDTLVAAKLLDENDEAGLKYLYRTKIDPSQAKYDIEGLFTNNGVWYKQVDPETFSYYAATDAFMTYKLYEWQKPLFDDPSFGPHKDTLGNDVKGLRWVFHDLEMPIVQVTAEMELYGVKIDKALCEKLQKKYMRLAKLSEEEISKTLLTLEPKIQAWKLTKAANEKTRQYQPKKSKKSLDEIEKAFPYADESGKRYKLGKSKVEQLTDPMNLSSPVQIAILFYDILGCEAVDKENPRATGEDALVEIQKRHPDLEICTKLLDYRGYVKLLTSYLKTIPALADHYPDGRMRFHLNSLGTDTGRYSAGGKVKYFDKELDDTVTMNGINIQNIPSRNHELRLLFCGDSIAKLIEEDDENTFVVDEASEIETDAGWKYCIDVNVGDSILVDNVSSIVTSREYNSSSREFIFKVE